MESRESGRNEESLTLFIAVNGLEEILRLATIDMLWRVRPSIRPPKADYSGTGREQRQPAIENPDLFTFTLHEHLSGNTL